MLVLIEKRPDNTEVKYLLDDETFLSALPGAEYMVVDTYTDKPAEGVTFEQTEEGLQISVDDQPLALILGIEDSGQHLEPASSLTPLWETAGMESVVQTSSRPNVLSGTDALPTYSRPENPADWKAGVTADFGTGFASRSDAEKKTESGGNTDTEPGTYNLNMTAVAGPFTEDVQVMVYDGDGNLLQASIHNFGDGSFTITLASDYQGLVFIKVSDSNGDAADYMNETGETLDLSSDLRAMAMVDGSAFNITVSPLTELAVRAAGVDETNFSESSLVYNDYVAQAFGLEDIISTTPVTTINADGTANPNYDATDGLSAGEAYGNILAKLSGANDIDTALDALIEAIELDQESGEARLSDEGESLLSQYIEQYEEKRNQDLPSLDTGDSGDSGDTEDTEDTGGNDAPPSDTTPPEVTSVSFPDTAMKVGDTVTVTITVADDADDTYTNISGTIGGFTLSNLTRINSTTYTAQFTITNSGTDVAAADDIPVSFTIDDGAGNTSTPYTTAVSQNNDAIDATPPAPVALTPADDATQVAVDANLTLTFDEAVYQGSGNLVIRDADTGNAVATIPVASAHVSGWGTTCLTIDPPNDLDPDTDYYIEITSGAFLDASGNASLSVDDAASWNFTTTDTIAPELTAFSSTTADGSYKAGDTINITATANETVKAGSTVTIELDTGESVVLEAVTDGTTLTGSYTVGSGVNSSDLTVSAITGASLEDLFGNTTTTSPAVPAVNLGDTSAIVVDTTAPATTFSQVSYDETSNTITLAGADMDDLLAAGDALGTDVKAQLNWDRFNWDYNGDGSADVSFSLDDIASATVTDAGTLTIVLTEAAAAALENDTGFDPLDYNDTVQISAGFCVDTVGNVATGDAFEGPTYTPTVSTIAVTGATGMQNGILVAGDTVTITVTMNNVTYVTGTPQLKLDIGGKEVWASYDSGSGTTTLVFTYTIQTGEEDANGISVVENSLSLNGGTLTGNTGTDAELGHAAVADNPSYPVDAVAPSAPGLSLADTGTPGDGITSDTTVDVTVEAGATWEYSLDGGSTWNTGTGTGFDLAGDTVYVSGQILARQTDAAGNLGAQASLGAVTTDTTAPAVVAVDGPADGTYKAGDTLEFTVNFDDDVTLGDETSTLSLILDGGTGTATYLSGSGSTAITYQYTVQSGDLDTDGITIGTLTLNTDTLTDTAGNAADLTLPDTDTSGVYVDGVKPGIAGVDIADGTYVIGDTITVTVTAADNETGLTLSGEFNGQDIANVQDNSDGTYTFTYTVVNGDDDVADGGSVANSLAFTDDAGNVSDAATITLDGESIDAHGPTLASASFSTDDAGEVYVNSDIVLTFSEDIAAGSGYITIVNDTDGTKTFTISITDTTQVSIDGNTLTINPTDNLYDVDDYHIEIDDTAITDTAGNAYAGINDSTTLYFTTDAVNVVFDLVNGQVVSDDPDAEGFEEDVAYNIYIYVDSYVDSANGESAFNDDFTEYKGGENLGADDTIILAGNDDYGVRDEADKTSTKMDYGSGLNSNYSFNRITWRLGSTGSDTMAIIYTLTSKYSKTVPFIRWTEDAMHKTFLWTGLRASAPQVGYVTNLNSFLATHFDYQIG